MCDRGIEDVLERMMFNVFGGIVGILVCQLLSCAVRRPTAAIVIVIVALVPSDACRSDARPKLRESS